MSNEDGMLDKGKYVGIKDTLFHPSPGSIPGSGRSPGEGNGNPLQYPYLENLMDTGDVGFSPWGRKELGTTE